MPFPRSGTAAAPAPAAAPAYAAPQSAPAMPGAPAMPSMPTMPQMPAAAPVIEPKFWVGINGVPLLHPLSALRTLPPTLQATNEANTDGWFTVGHYLAKHGQPAAVAAPQMAAPVQGGFAGRAAPSHASAAGVPNNLFAGIEVATFYRKNAKMTPGQYVAKITSHEYKQGQEKNMLIVELEILVSSYAEADPSTHEALREGTRAAAFVVRNTSWLPNIKEIIIAASGFDAQGKCRSETDTVTNEEAMALVDPSQPYAGALVYIEAKTIMTKKENKPFTLQNWWPMPVDASGTPDFEKLGLIRGG